MIDANDLANRLRWRPNLYAEAAAEMLEQQALEIAELKPASERWRNIRDYIDALVKERDYLRAELDRISART